MYEIHKRHQPRSESILRGVGLFCETILLHRRQQPHPEASPRHIDGFSELHDGRTFIGGLKIWSVVIRYFGWGMCSWNLFLKICQLYPRLASTISCQRRAIILLHPLFQLLLFPVSGISLLRVYRVIPFLCPTCDENTKREQNRPQTCPNE